MPARRRLHSGHLRPHPGPALGWPLSGAVPLARLGPLPTRHLQQPSRTGTEDGLASWSSSPLWEVWGLWAEGPTGVPPRAAPVLWPGGERGVRRGRGERRQGRGLEGDRHSGERVASRTGPKLTRAPAVPDPVSGSGLPLGSGSRLSPGCRSYPTRPQKASASTVRSAGTPPSLVGLAVLELGCWWRMVARPGPVQGPARLDSMPSRWCLPGLGQD